ncbi:MAG TPA: hypothetical protein VIJ52_06265 [Pseudolabrys sp.]
MANEPQPPQGMNPIPTQQANSFTLAANANELLVAFGVSRLSIHPTESGPTAQHAIEWVATLSISPVAAGQLVKLLQSGLQEYEKRFGKIPVDPGFKLTPSS